MSQGLRSEDMFDNAQDESAVELPPPNELVTAVDRLLNELGPKFSKMSTELFAKIDDMSRRLDDMEAAIRVGNENQGTRT